MRWSISNTGKRYQDHHLVGIDVVAGAVNIRVVLQQHTEFYVGCDGDAVACISGGNDVHGLAVLPCDTQANDLDRFYR